MYYVPVWFMITMIHIQLCICIKYDTEKLGVKSWHKINLHINTKLVYKVKYSYRCNYST